LLVERFSSTSAHQGARGVCAGENNMSSAYTGGCTRGTIGRESGKLAAVTAEVLSLAAAPTFAIMALLTGAFETSLPDVLCSATQLAWPVSGMVVMYLLMTAFHMAPWLKLISSRRDVGTRT
jgi:hypothetical protein